MIKLENISKHFMNHDQSVRQDVLNDISLTLEAGQSIAIVGPSGCGKSTLLNIIGTLDVPSTGDLFFEDRSLSDLNENERAEFRNEQIGFVFQMHHLLPQLNVLENVMLPSLMSSKEDVRIRAIELLKKLGLKDKLHQFPGQLSGGECQRVAVIRALINKPKLILADEPTGSLDQGSSRQIGDLLASLVKEDNIALITVTHSMELADKMQIKYMLIEGQLKAI